MSFKDLTAWAADAIKPKPTDTAKPPDNENESKAAGEKATDKSKPS